MRSITLIVSGLLAVLALGLGATPASAANSTGPCGVVVFDGEVGDLTIPNGSHAVAGTADISLPCDGGLWLTFTSEIATTGGGALVQVAHVVRCVAPAVPSGCTVSSTLLPVVPDEHTLQSGITQRATRAATAVVINLLRGNYHIEWQVINVDITGVATAGKRLSSAEGFGTLPTPTTLPTTPPGSSQ
jgi:hypothetical protein